MSPGAATHATLDALTPEQLAYAEEVQVLGAVVLHGPTLSGIAGSLDPIEWTHAPDGPDYFVVRWGDDDPARRRRVQRVLARLREHGLVRLARRRWMPTRAGAWLEGWDLRDWRRQVVDER